MNYGYHKINHTAYKSRDVIKPTDSDYKLAIENFKWNTLDAINILAKYDTPFTLFVTTENINKDIYLSYNDIHDISTIKNSVIGTHGFKHSKFGTMSYNDQYRELYLSKKKLAGIVNKHLS